MEKKKDENVGNKILKCSLCGYETTPGPIQLTNSFLDAHMAREHPTSTTEKTAPQQLTTTLATEAPPSYASVVGMPIASAPSEECFANPQIPHPSFAGGQIHWQQGTSYGNAGLDLQEDGEPRTSHPRANAEIDTTNENRLPQLYSIPNRSGCRSFIMLVALAAAVACIVIGASDLDGSGGEKCSKIVPLYSLLLGVGILLSLMLAFRRWFVSLGFVSIFVTTWYLLGYLFGMADQLSSGCTKEMKDHIHYVLYTLALFFIVFWFWAFSFKKRPSNFFCDPEAGAKSWERDPLQGKPFPEEHERSFKCHCPISVVFALIQFCAASLD